ncbi:MAG TPA: hypothetical protein VFX30_05470 [bacterium]|nr:hypothetical protein [bacterium]
MFHALQIQFRAPGGDYATATLLVEPGEILDYAAYIRAWSLENLPEGAQLLGAVVGWAPRPTPQMAERKLSKMISDSQLAGGR